MKIEIAKKAGFCFGVKKAIERTDVTLSKSKHIKSLGPLIHNRDVIEYYKEKGLDIAENIDEVSEGETVIIRTHGVKKEIIDKAEEKNINIENCTCPFVKKVQEKARKCYNLGKEVVIVGDSNHPEVIGINGWCDDKGVIVNSIEDIKNINFTKDICIVVQTTMTEEKFFLIVENIKKENPNKDIEVHNTICSATYERQRACKELAKKADAMIIIGGKNSSNTKKLAEISSQYCENIYFIENANNIDLLEFKKYNLVGITGGASTPDWIIEEVYDKLEKISEENYSEMEKAINESFKKISKWDTIEGKVVLVTKNEVIVNVGHKSDGIIEKMEFTSNEDDDLKELVKEGDLVKAVVITTNDGDGNIILSKRYLERKNTWNTLNEVYKNENEMEVKVIETRDSGLLVDVMGVNGFIPKSQISVDFLKDLDEYKGKTLNAIILDIDQKKNRLVLSSRKLEEEKNRKAKEEVLGSINEGQVVSGTVDKIVNYGAFIDLGGGVSGLLHISDISWNRIKSPKDVLKDGQKVEVIIQSIDKDNNRISLNMKKLTPEPWQVVSDKVQLGDIIEGPVVKNLAFGSFVEIIPGVEGLIHISQISNENIAKPSDVLKEGEVIKAKVIKIDLEKRRIELSKKELENTEVENKEETNSYVDEEPEVTIGDIVDKN